MAQTDWKPTEKRPDYNWRHDNKAVDWISDKMDAAIFGIAGIKDNHIPEPTTEIKVDIYIDDRFDILEELKKI